LLNKNIQFLAYDRGNYLFNVDRGTYSCTVYKTDVRIYELEIFG